MIPSGMTPQDNVPELKWSVLKVSTAKTEQQSLYDTYRYYLRWSVLKVSTAQGICSRKAVRLARSAAASFKHHMPLISLEVISGDDKYAPIGARVLANVGKSWKILANLGRFLENHVHACAKNIKIRCRNLINTRSWPSTGSGSHS